MEKQVVVIQEFKNNSPADNSGQIQITVQDPILYQKDTFNYFTYNIHGKDKEGTFNVRRRYSDFDLLRKKLSQRWLGVYIPPISGKRAQSNPLYVLKVFQSNTNQKKYAETRKKFLSYFCLGISTRPYLYYCELFQLFLRGGPDYQTSISGCILKEYSSLLHAYETSFKQIIDLAEKSNFNDLINHNEKHLSTLRHSQNNLQAICEKIYKATEAREQFNNQFNFCMKKTIPEYEETFLLSHVGRDRSKLILNHSQDFSHKLTEFQKLNSINPLQNFLQMIMYEIRQTKSFIEAIEGRKQAQKRKCDLRQKITDKQNQKAKLESGSFSFKALFKTGSKDIQINELIMKIQILKTQLACIEKMIVIMVINTNFQLEQYRHKRGKQYSQIFKKVAELELIELKSYEELLKIPLAAIG